MKTVNRYKTVVVAALLVLLCGTALVQGASPASAAASLKLQRATLPQGSAAIVFGYGFTSPDNVTVSFDAPVSGHAQHIQTTAIVNANGSFSARLSLPRAIASGVYTLTARDAHGNSSTASLTVLPLLFIRAGGPAATATVVAHSAFYIDAFGFAANEAVKIQVTFPTYSGNDVLVTRTPNANAQGNVVELTVTPPNGAKAGFAAVTAAGQTSNKQASGRVYVSYREVISLRNSTVTPGASVGVVGHGFVSYSEARIQITINGSNGSQTVSVSASTDANGNFVKYLTIPNYATPGTYSVVVTDVPTGSRHYARLVVQARAAKPTPRPTSKPTAAPTPKPTARPIHAVLSVLPGQTLPNQSISVSGTGYPSNATVTVSLTVDLRGGGNRLLSKPIFTDSNGNFTATFRIPFKAAQGTYTVNGSSGNAQSSGQLTVLPVSAHPSNLNFQYVSLWYHTVRHGTYDVISIQSTLQTTLGIWAHVIFPSGVRHDFYTNTNSSGTWSVKYSVPNNSTSRHSNQGYITFQLWHGSQTTQAFIDFTVV